MAGLTLVAAKPKLEQDIKKILEDAMYESEMTTMSDGEEPRVSAMVKSLLEQTSRKKAKKFAEQACKPMAEAIYNFVSEIGITLTPKGTLLAPQAPTGVLPISGTASTTTKDFMIT